MTIATLGFKADPIDLPRPRIGVSDECRDRMILCLAAMMSFEPPEAIARYMAEGFPSWLDDLLERPLWLEELSAHVDLLLVVQEGAA